MKIEDSENQDISSLVNLAELQVVNFISHAKHLYILEKLKILAIYN